MKTGFKLFLVSVLLSFVGANKKVHVVTFSELQKQIETKKNDTLYVVNFWATWCKPCELEIPLFEEAAVKFSKEKVKIIYVSLNTINETARVEDYVKTKKIQNHVLLLNAPNQNDWIDKVDYFWMGSIPATVMYKNGKEVFFKEGGFTKEEINVIITDKTSKIKS